MKWIKNLELLIFTHLRKYDYFYTFFSFFILGSIFLKNQKLNEMFYSFHIQLQLLSLVAFVVSCIFLLYSKLRDSDSQALSWALFFLFLSGLIRLKSYLLIKENPFYKANLEIVISNPFNQEYFFIRSKIFIILLLGLTVSLILTYHYVKILKKEIIARKKIEVAALENELKLERSLALSKATLEATADGILVVDRERKIVGYNQKFRKMWNIPESVLVSGRGEEASKYVLDQVKDSKQFIKDLEHFYNPEPGKEVIGRIEFKDGRIFERYTMPQMQGNEIIGRVFSFRDVTKKIQLENQLIFQATTDPLTLLPSRVILLDRIKQASTYSKRSPQIAAILFFDLDRFKYVNDSLGHDVGDVLLQTVARRLERCVRENDTVSRWGGDEFIILLTALSEEGEIIPIVEKCLHILEEVFIIGTYRLNITSSVGISILPKDGYDPTTLLKNADSAMYYAKAEGRNNYKFYNSEMNKYTKNQLELANDLHTAFANNQLTLHYQPIIDLRTGTIVGGEALLRWYHPKRGLIPSLEFIPIAEETGLILSIGEWILRTACFQNKSWQKIGLPPVCIAVNLSAQQFKQRDITKIVREILMETQLEPRYLDLELTESIIMGNTEAFLNIMKNLKKIGVGLVIDDFGTGYSSLSYLKRFPVNKIKIDKSFVQDMTTDSDDAGIVRAILAMAQELKLSVIAEGIETQEQLSFLQNHGCGEGQGFLFSKAVESEKFAHLLKKEKFSLK